MSVIPEFKKNFPEYLGWVPCVTGQHRFNRTCVGLGYCDKHTFNHKFSNNKRIIVMSAVVDWRDDRSEELNDGSFLVILHGSYNDNCFEGDCILLPLSLVRKYSDDFETILSNLEKLCGDIDQRNNKRF